MVSKKWCWVIENDYGIIVWEMVFETILENGVGKNVTGKDGGSLRGKFPSDSERIGIALFYIEIKEFPGVIYI